MSSAVAEGSPRKKRISSRARLGAEDGQSLVIVVAAMFVFLAICALAIDVAQWYQKHHSAQVAADAAALAAANCMTNARAGATCTSFQDTVNATSVATSYARTNSFTTPASQVNVNTTAGNVTVTTSAAAPVSFAGLISLHPSVSAVAVASWNVGNVPYSVFAGNPSCAAGSGLQIVSNGGGHSTIDGLYSDGVFNNNDNSGSAGYTGGIASSNGTPICGSNGASGSPDAWNTKDTSLNQSRGVVPYPTPYTAPSLSSCTYKATYFSTSSTGSNAITGPGVYCVTNSAGTALATSVSADSQGTPVCDNSKHGSTVNIDGVAGSIYLAPATPISSGSYEFVAPCIVTNGAFTTGVSSPNNQPLLFGNTFSSSGTCLNTAGDTVTTPANVVSSPPSIYLDGNNAVVGTIWAPCGTVEVVNNNAFDAFIEAANVTIDKNNFSSFAGIGPPNDVGGDTLTQ